MARALEGRADRPYVFTKCERVWNEAGEISPVLEAGSIRRECENSLRRLKLERIDLYQIHWPDPDHGIGLEAQNTKGGIPRLPPPRLASRLQRLPPILDNESQTPT